MLILPFKSNIWFLREKKKKCKIWKLRKKKNYKSVYFHNLFMYNFFKIVYTVSFFLKKKSMKKKAQNTLSKLLKIGIMKEYVGI